MVFKVRQLPVQCEEGEGAHGAVEAEREDPHLQGAALGKHCRLLPANNELTGGGCPVLGHKAENKEADKHCGICHGQVGHEQEGGLGGPALDGHEQYSKEHSQVQHEHGEQFQVGSSLP